MPQPHLSFQQNRIFTLNEPNAPRLNPALACEIGLNESIILLQLEFWIAISNNERDGMFWTYQSVRDMQATFPFWSLDTINRAIKSLEKKGFIITTTKYNTLKYDKTRWFTLNFQNLDKLESISIKGHHTRSTQNRTGSTQNRTGSTQDHTAPPSYTLDITRDSKPSAGETTPEISLKNTTTTDYASHSPILPTTTVQSSLSSPFNDCKKQNNIIPVENSQATTNTSNNCLINKVENDCNLNDIKNELIALVPIKHQQPIIIKFINQTLQSGVSADTIKSSIIYTNTHSKGNIKQYRSYLGKTIENPNWHIGYLEQIEFEQQFKQEVKNTESSKTNKNTESSKIDKGKEETETFDNFMKTVDIEAFDKFIETECWDSVNSVMRRLWKEGTRSFTRRLNMKKFIDAQNGTDIVDNSILPVAAQPSEPVKNSVQNSLKSSVSPSVKEVKSSKGGLTSLSFILSDIVTDLKPRPTL